MVTPDESAVRDRTHMRRALALARRGWGRTAPNPMVGAVLVREGRVVGAGWHARFGEAHAEVMALAKAGDAARGATMYVTLEPCAHTGKTPPCVDALIAAGVARVVVAMADPNAIAAGGADRLRAAGIPVEIGCEEAAAKELNAPFIFAAQQHARPWVTLKLALSLDGAIADHSRAPRWLTSATSRRMVHHLRANADAIAVGIGTALADDPALTVRGVRAPRVAPLRVVFDREGRLPVTSTLASSARRTPVAIVSRDPVPATAAGLRASGVDVLAAADLSAALFALRNRGVHHLFVEGGAALAGAFLGANLVDRLVIFQAPVILGAGALSAFGSLPGGTGEAVPRLRVVDRRVLEDDVMTTYAFSDVM